MVIRFCAKKATDVVNVSSFLLVLAAFMLAMVFAGCGNNVLEKDDSGTGFSSEVETQMADHEDMEEENDSMNMIVQVGESTFTATLEENGAVDALVDILEQEPLTIQMRDYSGFEKVGSLGENLPANDQYMTTQIGDLVLYQGNQVAMFYGSNSWSYTRIGRIDDLTDWKKALGKGDVLVTFSLADQ